jgi:hypothetical protein
MMRGAIKVRVVCPGCGPVVLPAKELRCELEPAGRKGICELRCPVCSTMVLVPAGSAAVEIPGYGCMIAEPSSIRWVRAA